MNNALVWSELVQLWLATQPDKSLLCVTDEAFQSALRSNQEYLADGLAQTLETLVQTTRDLVNQGLAGQALVDACNALKELLPFLEEGTYQAKFWVQNHTDWIVGEGVTLLKGEQ